MNRDPALALAVLREANGMANISTGGTVYSPESAIMSLGLQAVREVLQEEYDNATTYPEDVEFWFRVVRQKSCKAVTVAQILSSYVSPASKERAETTALFSYLGELLALSRYTKVFISLVESGARRSQLRYKISQQFSFDMEAEGFSYLKMCALPSSCVIALDPDSTGFSPEEGLVKNICQSAIEFVDAYVEDRLERLAPGVKIPPKSYRRLLRLDDAKYEALYEEIKTRLEQEDAELESEQVAQETASEISIDLEEGTPVITQEAVSYEAAEGALSEATGDSSEPSEEPQRKDSVSQVAPPAKKEAKPSKNELLLKKFVDIFAEIEKIDDLLNQLLNMLVDEGPFERAALMVVSQEQRKAIAAVSRGDVDKKQTVVIDDPLSPFLHMKGRVVSFGKRSSEVSPFGAQTFALAPLDLKMSKPVALYADCGDKTVLTFESRRLFRKVVDLVNHLVPCLEGGVPNELIEGSEDAAKEDEA